MSEIQKKSLPCDFPGGHDIDRVGHLLAFRRHGDPPQKSGSRGRESPVQFEGALAPGELRAAAGGEGPAPTTFGEVRVEILRRGRRSEVQWSGSWRRTPLRVEVRLPGFTALDASAVQGSALLEPEAGS